MSRTLSTEDLISRIVDGEDVDEAAIGAAERLRLAPALVLVGVARAFRDGTSVREAAPRAEPLFRWGALEALALVSEGPYGRVYRAWDPVLAREVALKLAPPELARGSDGQRFLDEARRLARVRHANVIAVHGAARNDGTPGFWSEWIDGRTLAQRVAADGALTPGEVTGLLGELADALAFVHARGLVHGDVKPANVLCARSGRVVLADFGAGGAPAEIASRVALSGTSAYLPPEVMAGHPPDAGADLYALARLGVFLLLGREPGPAPLDELARSRDDVPPRLRDTLARALDPDPARRHAHARAFADALAPPAPATLRVPRLAWVVLALLLAIAAGVGWLATRPPPWQLGAVYSLAGSAQPLPADAHIALGDALVLTLDTTRAAHVYVFNEDDTGSVAMLFPLARGTLANPLPAGHWTLPGANDGRELGWQVSADAAWDAFLIVASPSAIAPFDALLDAQASGADAGSTRGIGALVELPKERAVAGAGLKRLAEIAQRESPDALVRVRRFEHSR